MSRANSNRYVLTFWLTVILLLTISLFAYLMYRNIAGGKEYGGDSVPAISTQDGGSPQTPNAPSEEPTEPTEPNPPTEPTEPTVVMSDFPRAGQAIEGGYFQHCGGSEEDLMLSRHSVTLNKGGGLNRYTFILFSSKSTGLDVAKPGLYLAVFTESELAEVVSVSDDYVDLICSQTDAYGIKIFVSTLDCVNYYHFSFADFSVGFVRAFPSCSFLICPDDGQNQTVIYGVENGLHAEVLADDSSAIRSFYLFAPARALFTSFPHSVADKSGTLLLFDDAAPILFSSRYGFFETSYSFEGTLLQAEPRGLTDFVALTSSEDRITFHRYADGCETDSVSTESENGGFAKVGGGYALFGDFTVDLICAHADNIIFSVPKIDGRLISYVLFENKTYLLLRRNQSIALCSMDARLNLETLGEWSANDSKAEIEVTRSAVSVAFSSASAAHPFESAFGHYDVFLIRHLLQTE